MSIRRILIAVDDQPVSVRAAEFGSELGRSLGGEIALINVNDPAAEYGRAEQESKRLLNGFRDRLSLPPSTPEFVQSGIPGPTIVQKAKEWPADLIVIASHGRSGVPRALLGSVAEEVIRNAPCPVLVVRPQT
jgi:nucleotide-binding universal stress UspA family protein